MGELTIVLDSGGVVGAGCGLLGGEVAEMFDFSVLPLQADLGIPLSPSASVVPPMNALVPGAVSPEVRLALVHDVLSVGRGTKVAPSAIKPVVVLVIDVDSRIDDSENEAMKLDLPPGTVFRPSGIFDVVGVDDLDRTVLAITRVSMPLESADPVVVFLVHEGYVTLSQGNMSHGSSVPQVLSSSKRGALSL